MTKFDFLRYDILYGKKKQMNGITECQDLHKTMVSRQEFLLQEKGECEGEHLHIEQVRIDGSINISQMYKNKSSAGKTRRAPPPNQIHHSCGKHSS